MDAKNTVQERFFEFIPLQSATADSIATALKEHLATILPEDQKAKLICQAYDGASVMRGATAAFFPDHPSAQAFLIKLWPTDYQHPAMSDGTFTAVPSILCLSTERTSSAVSKAYKTGEFDPITVREAGAFAMLLEDQDFKFFLQLFHHIMPHVDLLYAKLQKKVIDSVCIQESIQQFQQDIQKIRNSLHSMVGQSSVGSSQPVKKRRKITVTLVYSSVI
ncbi:uncharacterized protein LOC115786093 isoform X2 [Archocentrus centrarchus]|uniref:uncharacterized protein LOC115786093 isoform X2 n=1 Tax=Archocentrus centrarchus TaxID=63155 RepID=UPI0011E9B5C7|nr:uncharacterized protein LOC115786093 isoform X2 [Archocentrus centrarchus]